MIAKTLLAVLGAAICLWVWWTVPLKGLRSGEEAAVQAETAADDMERDADTGPLMPVDEAQEVLDQYEEILIWVGDPLSRSKEADFIAVCPMMEQLLIDIVGLIGENTYSCFLGDARDKGNIGSARVLPLTLKATVLAEDGESPAEEAERLILAMEEEPSTLLKRFSAFEDHTVIVDAAGNPVPPRAYVEMNVDFYVLAEPPEDVRTAAEEKAAARSAAFESGALEEELLKDLLKRHAQGEQRDQGSE